MPNGGLLCVAFDTAPGNWLRLLVRDFERRPPPFGWRIAVGPAAAVALGLRAGRAPVEELAPDADAGCLARVLGDARCVLMAAAGWPAELALLGAARARGLRTAQYVETWYGYRRRVAPAPGWPRPDMLLLPDEVAVAEARAEGVSPVHARVVGNPVWEGILPDVPAGDRWLFIDAPVRRDYGSSLGYDEAQAWQLVVAEHRARAIPAPILFAPHPSEPGKPVPPGAEPARFSPALLADAATVFGMFSAPLVDAYLRGRRVVSVQPGAAVDMFPLSRRGLARRARDALELAAALDAPATGVDAAFRSSLDGSLARLRRATEEMFDDAA
jgi:hypothetical protein